MSELVSTIAYRHPKKEGMFLMVAEEVIWKDLPIELQTLFADKQEVVRFEMTSCKKLARVNGELVYQALREQGYFVQMPPADPHSLYASEEAWITQKEAGHLLQFRVK